MKWENFWITLSNTSKLMKTTVGNTWNNYHRFVNGKNIVLFFWISHFNDYDFRFGIHTPQIVTEITIQIPDFSFINFAVLQCLNHVFLKMESAREAFNEPTFCPITKYWTIKLFHFADFFWTGIYQTDSKFKP